MTEAVRVAAVQMNSGPDVEVNLGHAGRLLAEARAQGAVLAALPENFAFMGVRERDKLAVAEDPGSGPIQAWLGRTARQLDLWIVGGTIPLRTGDPGRVAAACLVHANDGELRARYDKMHLFDVDARAGGTGEERYRESATIMPGSDLTVVETPAGRLGLAVCYDVRFPELFRNLEALGATLYTVPAAFTRPTGDAHWEVLLRARAVENLAYVIAPAQTGRHANGRETHGDSLICDAWGRVLARRAGGPGVVVAEVDGAAQAEVRERFPALRHRRVKMLP